MVTKGSTKKRKTLATPRAFCTTCGDALDAYCFSPGATDIKELIKNLATCRDEGRLGGRVCAKLFIGGTDDLYKNTKRRRTPKKRLDDLKKAILREVSKETNRQT